MRPRTLVGAAALLAALTVVATWPLFRHPSVTVVDCSTLYGDAAKMIQRDINLTLWALAWGAHALATAPLRLFDANAFYPSPWSLALSEHMLGNQPLFGPVYLLTGNAVLAHQWTLFASFVLAGLTMAALVRRWTRDDAAALAAGVLYAFAPFRMWQIGNLHVVSTEWLPLVPLGCDLVLRDGRRLAGGVLAAAGLVLSTMCSYYLGYVAFVLAGAWSAVALLRGPEVRRRLPALLVAVALAALVLAAISVPYLLLQRSGVLPDRARTGFDSIAFLSLALEGLSGLVWRYLWPTHTGVAVFVGWVGLAAAIVGVVVWRRGPRAELLATALAGFVLSVGPDLNQAGVSLPMPWRLLAHVVPGFSAMRVPQRFGVLVSLAVAGLAGLALARGRARLRAGGRAALAAAAPVLVAALAVAETSLPLHLGVLPMLPAAAMPPAYRWLAAHGDGGAVIELPMTADQPLRQSQTMWWSTAHWLPLVNGYSAYPPPTFVAFMDASQAMPSADALARLRAVAPVRWFLVHRNWIDGDDARAAWDAVMQGGGLRRVGDFDAVTIWEDPGARR